MSALDLGALGVGVAGFLCAGWFYLHLWRWAKQCQGARIAIAYKRRVQLQAPLIEWLAWCNQLDRDRDHGGRVVYRNHGVSVAIMRRPKRPSPVAFLRNRVRRRAAPPQKVA